jgi:hypothetical protein
MKSKVTNRYPGKSQPHLGKASLRHPSSFAKRGNLQNVKPQNLAMSGSVIA